MDNNTHNHITYYEIDRYMHDKTLTPDLETISFFMDFDEKVGSCGTCNKRFHSYFILERLTEDETEFESWVSQLLDKLREEGRKFLSDLNFSLNPPPSFGLVGARGVGLTAVGASLVLPHVGVSIQKGDDYFSFELSEPTNLMFTISEEEATGVACELVLCREGDAEQCYPLKKSETGTLRAKLGELAEGRYIAVVPEVEGE